MEKSLKIIGIGIVPAHEEVCIQKHGQQKATQMCSPSYGHYCTVGLSQPVSLPDGHISAAVIKFHRHGEAVTGSQFQEGLKQWQVFFGKGLN